MVQHSRRKISAFALFLTVSSIALAAEPANLALHKPATSSSIENEEHNSAKANDGDADTCWRADDEPEGVPDWWQVDLEKPADLSGCQIVWPYDGINYRFKVEGSADGKTWAMLSDQSKTAERSQARELKFTNAAQIRFLKVTIVGFDDGCSASISEVKVFGR
jgi:alpha-L-fucosidase